MSVYLYDTLSKHYFFPRKELLYLNLWTVTWSFLLWLQLTAQCWKRLVELDFCWHSKCWDVLKMDEPTIWEKMSFLITEIKKFLLTQLGLIKLFMMEGPCRPRTSASARSPNSDPKSRSDPGWTSKSKVQLTNPFHLQRDRWMSPTWVSCLTVPTQDITHKVFTEQSCLNSRGTVGIILLICRKSNTY